MVLACAPWAGQEDKEKDFCDLYLMSIRSVMKLSRMGNLY